MARTEDQTKPEQQTTGGNLKPNQTEPATSPTSVQHREPEDAYLTGGQRNLQRRVLGLNVEENQAHASPSHSPGLHSTGSFTGVANGPDTTKAEREEDSSSKKK